CKRPCFSSPSMVTIRLLLAEDTLVTQDRVATPSIRTVQAPHWPSPHPYLLPVKSRSSRNTHRRLLSGSHFTRRLDPLTWSSSVSNICHLAMAIGRSGSTDPGWLKRVQQILVPAMER